MNAVGAAGPPALGKVNVVLTLRFRPGTADAVLAGIVPSIAPTRAEAGCRRFDVFRVTADPDMLVIFECWDSRAALEAHWELPYTKDALALFEAHLAESLEEGRNVRYLTDMTMDEDR